MSLRGFLAGLLTAQAIATVHVRLTGIAYFQKANSLLEAGYLAVPGAAAAQSLKGWGAAFCGGLFFTLTVGMGLTLPAVLTAWTWRRHHARTFPVRVCIAALWLALLALLNANGFSAAATAYGVLIPAAVLAASARLPEKRADIPRTAAAIHLIGFILLGGIGARCVDAAFFSGIRDHLLLSNAAGIGINHFYYRYTLLAAQAFKSLDQDLLRTCRFTGPADDPSTESRLKHRLARLDWLAVEDGHPADMVISGDRERLSLSHRGREILTVPADDFLARPQAVLADFSAGADRKAGLRWLAYASLTGVCILSVYGALYFPARRVFGWMFGPTAAVAGAAAVAVVAAGALVWFTPWARYAPGAGIAGKADLRQLLASDDRALRTAGLAWIVRKRLDIARFADPESLARSPDLRERLWLARALGISRTPDTFPTLARLLDDPRINVAYQACHALGRRGDRRGVAALLSLIGRSRDWYVQLYAYRAMRRLGWHQDLSG